MEGHMHTTCMLSSQAKNFSLMLRLINRSHTPMAQCLQQLKKNCISSIEKEYIKLRDSEMIGV